MATTSIHSKGDYQLEEYTAGEAGIYPGMLLELDSSGNVLKHNTSGGFAERLFALEDALQGNTSATVYTNGTPVQCIIPCQGGEIRALIKAGEDIAIGDKLISDGDGLLIEAAGSDEDVVAYATEANDLTASGAVNTLSKVRMR